MKFNLFSCGFRPGFLFAGIAALLLVPLWALSFVFGTPLGSSWPPTLWHGHEMLFGFLGSAVAGFLLTAVPSWTGQKGVSGRPLVVLASVWLAARLLIATSGWWPGALIAAVDLSFLPLLAFLVAGPLLRPRNRNAVLLVVLSALWLTDVIFHVALIRKNPVLASHAVNIGIDIVLTLVTVIGGRIVPAFTAAALRQQGVQGVVQSRLVLTVLAIAAMVLLTLGDILWPDSHVAGAIAGIAAIIQGARLVQWRTLRTLRQPIVWILHLAYAWLPIGLALKAAAMLGGYAIAAFWLHALTIGALTTMVTAVMTRASLGHTGRPLVVHPVITVAYALLTAAAVVRVFGLSGFGLSFPLVVVWSALFWTTAFALFVGVYLPILWGPRADGMPG
jgi:uncharacterized protein involved in response to NO